MSNTYEYYKECYRVVKCPHPGAHDTTVLTKMGTSMSECVLELSSAMASFIDTLF